MEDQFDAQALMVRVNAVAKEIRKSEAYPALIGGIAGGIAGALMAALIAGRRPAVQSTPTNDRGGRGWSLREVVQLITVVASLAKQVQAWSKEQRK